MQSGDSHFKDELIGRPHFIIPRDLNRSMYVLIHLAEDHFFIHMNWLSEFTTHLFLHTLIFTLLVMEVPANMCWWRGISMCLFRNEFSLFSSFLQPRSITLIVILTYRGQKPISSRPSWSAFEVLYSLRPLGFYLQPLDENHGSSHIHSSSCGTPRQYRKIL